MSTGLPPLGHCSPSNRVARISPTTEIGRRVKTEAHTISRGRLTLRAAELPHRPVMKMKAIALSRALRCSPDIATGSDRADFDQTYLQPFIAYTTPQAWTFTLQGEDTYDWRPICEWMAPINFLVAKIVKIEGTARSASLAVCAIGPTSRHRPSWFRWSARDDLPVSDAVIEAESFACDVRCWHLADVVSVSLHVRS